MLEAVPRAAFSLLASSTVVKRLASRYGMRRPDSFGRRFIAGETVDEALVAARELRDGGFAVTLDLLGESVESVDSAAAATRAYLGTIEAMLAAGVARYVSVKLSQLGLDVDQATAIDNVRQLVDAGAERDVFVRLDMESSAYTEQTFEVFDTLWNLGYRNVGVVIQSYLRRSADDVRRVIAQGATVRLVKGAYREPREVAFQRKEEVDASFVELMRQLVADGLSPAIATHDPAMIDATKAYAAERGVAPEAYEFQMLYGVRRDLQASLLAEGYQVRVYVPFGREWFPYFMRRLGERPANVGFVLRSLIGERRAGAAR
jgi:proline dehydrogenase